MLSAGHSLSLINSSQQAHELSTFSPLTDEVSEDQLLLKFSQLVKIPTQVSCT